MSEKVQGLIRHAMTAVGGILMANGYIDEAGVEAGTGFVLAVTGLGWALYSKEDVGWPMVQSIVRHGFSTASGVAVAQGWVSADVAANVTAGVLALAAGGWSLWSKRTE